MDARHLPVFGHWILDYYYSDHSCGLSAIVLLLARIHGSGNCKRCLYWRANILLRQWDWGYAHWCHHSLHTNSNYLRIADAAFSEDSSDRYPASRQFVCAFLNLSILLDWQFLTFCVENSVCAASICRILALQKNTHGTDATWTMAPVFIWSSVEPFVGIICACLPTFGPFFRRWWSSVRTGRSSSPGPSSNPSANRPPGTATWFRKSRSNKMPKDSLFSINEFGCVDEVQLMNDINASRSVREDAASDDHDVERGDSEGNITVKQDVDISWEQSRKPRR